MDLELTVLAGRGATVQDLGRHAARRGLATGGARDQRSARAANALVGARPDAPLAEIVLGELALAADRDLLVAATGPGATLTLDGVAVPADAPLVVPARAEIRVRVTAGVAAYLAVAGSWAVPLLAGSAAPDPGLGFATTLEPGRTVPVAGAPGPLTDAVLGVALVRPPPLPGRPPAAPARIDLLPGPDLDDGLRGALADAVLAVDPRSDHVGVRLTGPLPPPAPRDEPVSRGVPVGAVELPGAAGELIVLQRGRSLTAGYPVVAVVSSATQDVIAQLRPGDRVRTRWRTRAETVEDALRRRQAERLVEQRVRSALDTPH